MNKVYLDTKLLYKEIQTQIKQNNTHHQLKQFDYLKLYISCTKTIVIKQK